MNESRVASWQWGVVLLALAAPLAFWVVQWPLYFSWGDEVQFVDPAASAHFGQGFVSMAWPYQDSREFFAGNAPGYSLLLVPWFALVGFGLEQARWLNVPLALASAAVLMLGLRRAMPGMPPWLQAVSVGAGLLGFGMLVSAGSARYDMLCLLAAAFVFVLLAAPEARPGIGWLVLAGAFVFYAGFHLVAALVVIMVLLTLQDRRRFVRPAVFLVAGVAAGLASWLAVLATRGLFVKFFVMLFGSQHTLTGQMAKLVIQGDKGVLTKLQALAGLPMLDASLSVMALLLLVLLLAQWGLRGPVAGGGRLVGWLALDFAFLLPVALLLVGKFPVYYCWMAYVPAVLVAACWCWSLHAQGLRWALPAFLACAALAVALGVGLRVARADVPAGDRSYAAFNAWVSTELHRSDWVYSDHEAYFAARAAAARTLGPTYAQTSMVRGIPESSRVTVLLVQRPNQPRVTALLGGDWRLASEFKATGAGAASPGKLDYVLLRRATP